MEEEAPGIHPSIKATTELNIYLNKRLWNSRSSRTFVAHRRELEGEVGKFSSVSAFP